jgi:hypothetical protein
MNEVNKQLLPQSQTLIKDFNKLVDSHLKLVVDKINIKLELQKKGRELNDKYNKRKDEIRSIAIQKSMLNS